ncbi:hypothetical protein [Rhizorhabdus sp. FW153]|uniref:hypothetical protein n=1 Tax=Rhizorhabdus sp. FW153 TaxID=3400216 RepID=UPI003CE7E8D5
MNDWSPATKDDVLRAIADVAADTGPDWVRYEERLIDPYPSTIERFGRRECAFVVARTATRVVFFDDIEETFGTATEEAGKLIYRADFGDLRLAIKEALAGG